MSLLSVASAAAQQDQMYFPATDNVINQIVNRINAETVRLDISAWYLTEHSISIAIANRFAAGVPVRLIGDRASIFEIDPNTKTEFYWLAAQGIPIRLRYNPTWFPEIDHWKVGIFVGQGVVEFGSANWTTFELAPDPANADNYHDETALFSSDPTLFGAIETHFNQMWVDTTNEPESIYGPAPYFKDWYDACSLESACSDFKTLYPKPAPMVIDRTSKVTSPTAPPADMILGQGPDFNSRLDTEINNETKAIKFVIYRLTVADITQALLGRAQAGVPVQLIIEPNEYNNSKWPEFWQTHANIDQLWAAGIPIKIRIHPGLTHMKMLVTSNYATNASSNYASHWQRDVDYFVSAAAKPTIYTAMANRFQAMWTNTTDFAPFTPGPPNAAGLASPANASAGASLTPTLTWNAGTFATSYDVYMGTSPGSLSLVGNVPAQIVDNPPSQYSYTPSTPLNGGTTYYWQIVAKTFATPKMPSLVAQSDVWSFTTTGTAGPPPAPTNPSPATGATNQAIPVTLQWTGGPGGTSYTVKFGTSPTPSQVATGLTTTSYTPSGLNPSTTYYWQIVALNGAGSTAGPVWSFTTSATAPPPNIVVYAGDIPSTAVHGAFSLVSDTTAAGGSKLVTPATATSNTSSALAAPTDYVDVTFSANAGVPYALWLRLQATNNSKYSDSAWVQFSDAQAGGSPVDQINSTNALLVNLEPCSGCGDSGWGWQNGAWWLTQATTFTFATSGTHTMRIQLREAGVQFDQVVLSPQQYLNSAPGPVANDTTIVPKPTPTTAPSAPTSPSPANGATGVSTTASLTWSASGATTYNVLFGTTNPPPQVATGISTASYTPASMASGTTYYWQIVAINSGGSTTGPVWSFTTTATAPSAPANPSPASGATGVATNATLSWSVASGATKYNVLFGTTNPPPQVATGITATSYAPSGMSYSTTYYWQIVAVNSYGSTAGPVWSFTTGAAPTPPSAPTNPSPAAGATGVATNATLTWSAATGASTYTINFGTANPPPQVATGVTATSYTPTMTAGATYYWQVTAVNAGGSTPAAVWSFTTASAPANIVIYAGDIPASAIHGAFALTSDATAAGGSKLATPTTATSNTSAPLASPADYVDATFSANAGVAYTLWLRIQATGNSKYSDSVWVQFSDALSGGSAIYPMNSVSGLGVNLATDSTGASDQGWGWVDGAYWMTQVATVSFANSGTHTIRIQVREAGVQFDQIVLSPATYFNQAASCPTSCTGAPGSQSNDNTIVPKSASTPPPSAPSSPNPASGATGVATNATLSWATATGASSYSVLFSTTNPPSQVATGVTTTSYTPSGMAGSTTYYWQIVAVNSGGSTSGPVWSFTTAASVQPPAAPASPNPASGATGIATNATLSWGAAGGATSYTMKFGTTNPPPQVATGITTTSYSPVSMTASTTYYWQVIAVNGAGSTPGPVWSFTTAAAPSNIVLWASSVPSTGIHGAFTMTTDTTAAGGAKLATPATATSNTSAPLASPTDYVDLTFNADAGVAYTLWLRLQATNNSKYSDSLWVQFSDAQVGGSPAYQINSTNGLLVNLATDSTGASDQAWGWVDGAYWMTQTATVTFASSGSHTVRLQVREAGVQFDQVVLSPTTYFNSSASCPVSCTGAPGVQSNDTTILPKQ